MSRWPNVKLQAADWLCMQLSARNCCVQSSGGGGVKAGNGSNHFYIHQTPLTDHKVSQESLKFQTGTNMIVKTHSIVDNVYRGHFCSDQT